MSDSGMSVQIVDAVSDEKEIIVKLSNGTVVQLCHFWFRDNCRCGVCYNKQTFQRMHNILDIPEEAKPKKLSVISNVVNVEWSDGHVSEYSAEFLWRCWPKSKRTLTKRVLWSGDEASRGVAAVARDDFLKSNHTLGVFLRSLITYGVAFVDGVEPTMEDTTRIIKRVGPIQNTLFGDTWHFTSDMARADTAYTSIPLGAHTDNIYFTEAAGLQILHCLEHDGEGGETILLDGFKCAEDMRSAEPKMFDMLTRINQPGEYHEKGYHHHCDEPTLILEPSTGEMKQIRFNVYDRSGDCVAIGDELVEFYKAYKTLARRLNDPNGQWKFKLTPGRVLFFDNWRVLHGRAGFTGKRYIGGAYISRGDYLSAARVQGIIQ